MSAQALTTGTPAAEADAKARELLDRRYGIERPPCPEEHWDEWNRCKADVGYWVQKYVRTYDPREPEGERWVTFNLWPRQVEYLKWLTERYKAQEPCVVKKCRDVGASWLTISFCVHVWLFEKDAKVAMGSRKAELVDQRGNPDTLFEKARETIRHLPDWMRPKMRPSTDDMEFRLINKAMGSVMTGEGGDKMGTGGRNGVYFIDEFAKVERSVKVQAAVEDNARFRIYVSTPEGLDNEFARMCRSGVPRFDFTYKDDPRRSSWVLVSPTDGWTVRQDGPDGGWKFEATGEVVQEGLGKEAPPGAVYPWYEEQRKTRHPVNLAQEVDGDLFASMQDAVCPAEWVRAAIKAPVKGTGPLLGGLDLGGGARPSTVLAVRRGPECLGVFRRSGPVGSAVQTLVDAIKRGGYSIQTIAYDAGGDTGASFGQTLKKFGETPFKFVPLIGQKSASRRVWEDGKRSEERFLNLRAEAWWVFRERLRKTYEKFVEGIEHPDDECASIPDDETLLFELSSVQFEVTETGKYKIESKSRMKERGMDSPDTADAVVLAYWAEPPPPKMVGRFQKRR